jgi:outer membrane protein OmpA-like peptidoglycan-associated protein
MRIPPKGLVGLLALLLLVGGCSGALENVPPRPAAIEDPAVADAAFPELASVPARPQLSYTLEQRREIAEGLVADRANARYTGDALRRALDRPVRPDMAPPLPPPPADAETASTRDPGSDLTLAYIEEALARDSDGGSLNDFLDRLQQPPPAAADVLPPVEEDPATIGDGVDPAAGPAAATTDRAGIATPTVDAETEPPSASAAAGMVDEATPVAMPEPAAGEDKAAVAEPGPMTISRDDEAIAAPPVEPSTAEAVAPAAGRATPPPASPAKPDPELPLAILFEPNGLEVEEAQHVKLHQLAPQLADTAATIVVSGGGPRAGLAMERARRVAATLVEAGLLPTRIAIEMGGESDVVVVYEAGV